MHYKYCTPEQPNMFSVSIVNIREDKKTSRISKLAENVKALMVKDSKKKLREKSNNRGHSLLTSHILCVLWHPTILSQVWVVRKTYLMTSLHPRPRMTSFMDGPFLPSRKSLPKQSFRIGRNLRWRPSTLGGMPTVRGPPWLKAKQATKRSSFFEQSLLFFRTSKTDWDIE